MKKTLTILVSLMLLMAVALLAMPLPAFGQSAEYRVDVNRDFGYGAGSDVRGNFSIKLFGDLDNVQSVTYFIDDQEMATLSEAPFRHKFVTDQYPAGWHNVTAQVQTKDGRQVTTPAVKLNFLSAEQQNAGMQRIFIPLIGLILVISFGGMAIQYFFVRGGSAPAPGAVRNYGFKGGTICPRCERAFAINFFSINLVGGVLDRCPYCGRFGFVTRKSAKDLQAAEQAELRAARAAESGPIDGVSGTNLEETEEERVRKLLDQSRYTDNP